MLLDGRELDGEVARAAALLAVVAGQDLDVSGEVFRIARRVAPDRVISTVDPEARHGHKTAARGFDGYKGHVAVDPDSEIITAIVVTPGNAGDASVAEDLVADLVGDSEGTGGEGGERPAVYGDNAYGSGEFQSHLEDNDIASGCKTAAPTAPDGHFSKDAFTIDLEDDTVTCPNGVSVEIRRNDKGEGTANFGRVCATCPLRDQCTSSPEGRSVAVGVHEDVLARARRRQKDPEWKADYRATRPKVERKLGHLTRRRHGGRRARVRGKAKVGADFKLLAAAVNLARLAVLGVHYTTTGWTATAS
jgi:hypothetical protein